MQEYGFIRIRISKKLKKELKELGIDYSEVAKRYIEKRVKQELLKKH